MNEKRNPLNQKTFPDIQSEFSRILEVSKLTFLPTTLTFTASEEEKRNLSKRLNLVSIKDLKIHCKIQGSLGHYPLHVSALLTSSVVQCCVITLCDIQTMIQEKVHLKLFSSGTKLEECLEKFDENEPESIALDYDSTIDLGEIFVQYLSLSLDPYPRAKVREAP